MREVPVRADHGIGSRIEVLHVPALRHGHQVSEISAASRAAVHGIHARPVAYYRNGPSGQVGFCATTTTNVIPVTANFLSIQQDSPSLTRRRDAAEDSRSGCNRAICRLNRGCAPGLEQKHDR